MQAGAKRREYLVRLLAEPDESSREVRGFAAKRHMLAIRRQVAGGRVQMVRHCSSAVTSAGPTARANAVHAQERVGAGVVEIETSDWGVENTGARDAQDVFQVNEFYEDVKARCLASLRLSGQPVLLPTPLPPPPPPQANPAS